MRSFAPLTLFSIIACAMVIPSGIYAQGTLASDPEETAPIKIVSADTVRQERDAQELLGNVVLDRGGLRLSATRMRYSRKDGVLQAWDNVEIRDPEFVLLCDRLSFDIRNDEVVAWGAPRLIQREEKSARAFETELTGVQVRIFPKERRVQVLEQVVLSRYLLKQGKRNAVELRVRCRSLDLLSAARRSVFKGGVSIETPTIGATGDHALFDQLAGTFYILGRSEAWNYGDSGCRVNVVRGEKIVYFLEERRSVVIGGVTADVEPDVKTSARAIPMRVDPVARPGEVLENE